ncbi:MAG TPA: glycosyltransferase family 9 protein [Gemmatimonadaceae bacterium]|nr:glycosyltransferase family 9 protein [Gemmatimonadaceae bacterium]
MSDRRMDRVCIVMMSAVGDAVHVLPVINAIKRHNPSSQITWVLQPGPASLVQGHPAVDEVILFDRSRGIAAFREVISKLRARRFDLLINLQVYFKAGIITAFSGIPRRLGFDRARARDANWLFTTERIAAHKVQHVQDQYFEFLHALGIDPNPVEWGLGPWDDEREWQRSFVAQFHDPLATIIVATSKPEKDWDATRWAHVCDLLRERYNLQPVLAGGSSERERKAAAEIVRLTDSQPHVALGSGLRRLVSILDASQVVLSPDTGPLHISVALNRPVISLIGYTDPRRTGPWRRFQDLVIDAYHEAGENGPVTMATRKDRMPRITVDDVAAKLSLWNDRYRGKS